MAWPIIVAWIHYVSIMLMIASLLGEHLLLKQELTAAQAGTVQRLDIVYGASAAIVLITGILRMFLEKGAAYYNHHIAFHILFRIFVIAALMSIYPTLVFLRWRSDTSAGRGQQLAQDQFKRIQMILRVEMTLLLLAPLRDLDGARRVLAQSGRADWRNPPIATDAAQIRGACHRARVRATRWLLLPAARCG